MGGASKNSTMPAWKNQNPLTPLTDPNAYQQGASGPVPITQSGSTTTMSGSSSGSPLGPVFDPNATQTPGTSQPLYVPQHIVGQTPQVSPINFGGITPQSITNPNQGTKF